MSRPTLRGRNNVVGIASTVEPNRIPLHNMTGDSDTRSSADLAKTVNVVCCTPPQARRVKRWGPARLQRTSPTYVQLVMDHIRFELEILPGS